MTEHKKKLRVGQNYNPHEIPKQTPPTVAPKRPTSSEDYWGVLDEETAPKANQNFQATQAPQLQYNSPQLTEDQLQQLLYYQYMMTLQQQGLNHGMPQPPNYQSFPQAQYTDISNQNPGMTSFPHEQTPPFQIDFEAYSANPEAYLESLEPYQLDEVYAMLEQNEMDNINEIVNDLQKEEDLALKKTFKPDLASCSCCKGFIYNCKDRICKKLEVCKCYAHKLEEQEHDEKLIEECIKCKCCRGYVYTCLGEKCKENGVCFCFQDSG